MTKKIEYKLNTMITAEELSRLFKASGIKRPVDDLPRLAKMITNADLTFTAWDGEKLVGVARAITDFSYCCYLSDLAVDRDYQKRGIGKKLVNLLQEQIGEEVMLLLLSSPIAMEYYPRIGFDQVDNGFIIKRKR
ncbi:GNAT family N-acetyltransferase [Neobacillus sp. OS1-32]|jgi:ribosomal protein S18 acetylase RimI-like enzyme|uniref:GNAT family N-acetyltransferase n=1 Tax=Neobacillus paridis TaxID=2803862 RepID=A0ABS1TQA9_9BACI|nr:MULTISPECIES: GNAT family N-acetyltransferase [Neobacillus]MBL4953513.1 GNAT family N-acetyltransferase [Neobacillus paridis]WML29168.1 GNAT family N-acetyltransferase [Neobacillus sp. OS1-32]